MLASCSRLDGSTAAVGATVAHCVALACAEAAVEAVADVAVAYGTVGNAGRTALHAGTSGTHVCGATVLNTVCVDEHGQLVAVLDASVVLVAAVTDDASVVLVDALLKLESVVLNAVLLAIESVALLDTAPVLDVAESVNVALLTAESVALEATVVEGATVAAAAHAGEPRNDSRLWIAGGGAGRATEKNTSHVASDVAPGTSAGSVTRPHAVGVTVDDAVTVTEAVSVT